MHSTRTPARDQRARPRAHAQSRARAPRAPVRGDQAVVVLRAEAQLRHHLVDLLVQQRRVQVRPPRVDLLRAARGSAPARARRRATRAAAGQAGSGTAAVARSLVTSAPNLFQPYQSARACLQLVQQRGHALHVLAAGLQLGLDGLLARGHRQLLAVRRQELLLRARAAPG